MNSTRSILVVLGLLVLCACLLGGPKSSVSDRLQKSDNAQPHFDKDPGLISLLYDNGDRTNRAILTSKPEVYAGEVSSATTNTGLGMIKPLPAILLGLKEAGNRFPSVLALGAINEEDRAAIFAVYHGTSQLTHRLASTMALARLGGDDVVAALTNTIGGEFEGSVFSGPEWRVVEFTLHALGVMGQSSGGARAFLLDAAEGDFWIGFRKWRFEHPAMEAQSVQLLKSSTWEALGFAPTENVARSRLEVRTSNDYSLSPLIANSLLASAFYSDVAKSMAPSGVWEVFATPGAMQNRFVE